MYVITRLQSGNQQVSFYNLLLIKIKKTTTFSALHLDTHPCKVGPMKVRMSHTSLHDQHNRSDGPHVFTNTFNSDGFFFSPPCFFLSPRTMTSTSDPLSPVNKGVLSPKLTALLKSLCWSTLLVCRECDGCLLAFMVVLKNIAKYQSCSHIAASTPAEIHGSYMPHFFISFSQALSKAGADVRVMSRGFNSHKSFSSSPFLYPSSTKLYTK